MTPQEKQNAFCSNVAAVVAEKRGIDHHPDGGCMHGACSECRKRRFNWRVLWELSTAFWKTAPEIDGEWAWDVRRTGFGFTVDELHALMVGVFMGSDRPQKPTFKPVPNWFKAIIEKGLWPSTTERN